MLHGFFWLWPAQSRLNANNPRDLLHPFSFPEQIKSHTTAPAPLLSSSLRFLLVVVFVHRRLEQERIAAAVHTDDVDDDGDDDSGGGCGDLMLRTQERVAAL